ncbi:hypothetical protein ScPMuIL_008023 [Solemya velum]
MDVMDPTADPCENFFQYACGNWNKRHVIPEDKSSFNTFEKLHDDLQLTLKGLLEEPPDKDDSQSAVKVKTLYKSCVNVSQIEKISDIPLREVLADLGSWPVVEQHWDPSKFVLEDVLGTMRGKYNAPILIDCWVGPDDKNSSVNIIQLEQPTLGMPSREYYLHSESWNYIQAYLNYMTNVALLMGANKSTGPMEMFEVLKFETALANVTIPQSERHDTGALYKKLKVRELIRSVPDFHWMKYFNSFLPYPITENEEIVTYAPKYIKNMIELTRKTDPRIVANYVIWRVILGFAPEMTESYQLLRNEYRKVLQGVLTDKQRWKKCVEYVNERLGLAVGAMFIKEHFRKGSKKTALEMIHNIRAAFNELLEENNWMDDETRSVARQKANAMNERIGYPEFITVKEELDIKYEALHFDVDYYFENILKVEKFAANKTMKNFRQRVEKEKWEQDPAIVNAFYNPNTNEIVFPAGILQPLFYSEHFPKSLNYGGIGVVIGHEITHGFDDKGRQYDKEGNMKQWWKNVTIEAFQERAQCIVDQYSKYKLDQIGLFIDGKNTKGENIADNGGLKQSYRAYRKWVAKHGEEDSMPGLEHTHDQLFFLNYAQIWCGMMRDEEALHKIRTSVHSPGPIRVMGPLSNSEDFSRVYNCPLGSKMNPVHKCSVW